MTDVRTRTGRAVVAVGGTLLLVALAFVAFVAFPQSMVQLLGVLLVILAGVIGLRLFASLARTLFPSYNVASVSVEGPITRRGGRRIPMQPGAIPADDVVDQIDAANDDSNVEGLLLELNTPGGEVVPSDDIRMAVERFDGPAVAYVTDVCASGGYWIASECDEVFAHDASLVGSIGVNGSRVTANELAERVGLSYERFAAGKYKDTGVPLRELEDDERAYLQGLVDDIYETFVDRVTTSRGLDRDLIRETEARIFLGREAADLELVDEIGTREDAEDRLAALVGIDEALVEPFEPAHGLFDRVGGGMQALAYAFGAGVARSVVGDEKPLDLRL